MGNAAAQLQWHCREAAIQQYRTRFLGRVRGRGYQHSEVGRGVVARAGLEYDERARESCRLLAQLIDVRVIDERARTRGRESRFERVAGRDHRSEPPVAPAESLHPIEIALQFDTVPVYGSGLRRAVHNHDAHRLAAGEPDQPTRVTSLIAPPAPVRAPKRL